MCSRLGIWCSDHHGGQRRHANHPPAQFATMLATARVRQAKLVKRYRSLSKRITSAKLRSLSLPHKTAHIHAKRRPAKSVAANIVQLGFFLYSSVYPR